MRVQDRRASDDDAFVSFLDAFLWLMLVQSLFSDVGCVLLTAFIVLRLASALVPITVGVAAATARSNNSSNSNSSRLQ